jgi:hypothetical protein
MTKTCFVHAGTVKTGSSALQYALAVKQDDLLDSGFNFPDLEGNFSKLRRGSPTGGNAGSLRDALQLREPDRATDFVRPFAAHPHHLILSNEGLSQVNQAAIKAFCEQVRGLGFQTKCLVFFRPQTELVVSAYLQKVKASKDSDWPDLEHYATSQDFENRRNWFVMAKRLEDAFGSGNVTVKWYPALRRGKGIVGAAFDWLGLPTPVLKAPVVNPTPGCEAMMILKRANSAGVGGRRFADPFLSQAEQQGLLGSKLALSAKSARAVYEATRSSNEQLFRRYFPELSVEQELAIPLERESPPPDDRLLERLAAIAADILRQRGASSEALDKILGMPATLE